MELTDNRRHSFFIIDNEVIDEYGLDPYAFYVYSYLARLCGEDHKCFPSLSKITEKLKISRPTVCKAIKTLSSLKLVSIKKVLLDDTKSFENNVYTLLPVDKCKCKKEGKPVSNVYQGATGSEVTVDVAPGTIVPINSIKDLSRFDDFYDNIYPYKMEKGRALKAYTKHITSKKKHHDLINAFSNYKILKPEKQYWKNPATFINNYTEYLNVEIPKGKLPWEERKKAENKPINRAKILADYKKYKETSSSMDEIIKKISKENNQSYNKILGIIRRNR